MKSSDERLCREEQAQPERVSGEAEIEQGTK
jgi:hypothetical protein